MAKTSQSRSKKLFIRDSASPLCHAVLLGLFAISSASYSQSLTPPVQPRVGSNWERVKALPVNTRVHIATDRGGRTCRIFAVADDSITCAKGSLAGAVLARAQITHIRLTHYGRSTLVGVAIGGGIGGTAGAIGGRTKPCSTGQTLCLNGLGVGTGGVAAIFGVVGGLVGGVVGGAFDITRGSSIYVRP